MLGTRLLPNAHGSFRVHAGPPVTLDGAASGIKTDCLPGQLTLVTYFSLQLLSPVNVQADRLHDPDMFTEPFAPWVGSF